MIDRKKVESKVLVFDTNCYAGNFERAFTAYVTGQLNEFNMYEEMAKVFSKDIKNLKWWEENISPQAAGEFEDDNQYVCSIWPTEGITPDGKPMKPNKNGSMPDPGYFSIAIFVEEFPPEDVLKEALERAQHFGKHTKEIYAKSKSNRSETLMSGNKEILINGYRMLEPVVKKVVSKKKETVDFTVSKKNSFKF